MITIVLPCRNEEQAVAICIEKIEQVLKEVKHEIIISDSSTDQSPIIAAKHGARVIKHDKEGYGIALITGIESATYDYILMMDCDNTYDFDKIPRFIEALDDGYEFIIGDRFKGGIMKGAMPWHHKYIGNPILSTLARLFMDTKVRDVHCGMRAFTKEAYHKMQLQTTGMEYATEMVAKASKKKLKTTQIPIKYRKRIGASKLSSFRDGWRHLRFMLLYTPGFLFLIPAIYLMLFGITGMIYFPGQFMSGTMAMMTLFGYQLLFFFAFSKVYMLNHLGDENKALENTFKYLTIERASITGIILCAVSVLYFFKEPLLTITLGLLGLQTIFSAFMLSTLGIQKRKI